VAFPILVSYAFAAATAFLATYSAFRSRPAPGSRSLFLFFLFLGSYFTAALGEATTPFIPGKVLFLKLEYTFLSLTAPLFLLFTLEYLGRMGKSMRLAFAILLVEPALTIALVWTNEQHQLIWKYFELSPHGTWLLPIYGGWFWLHTAYASSLVLLGIGLFLPALPTMQRALQTTMAIVLTGVFITLWGVALYVTRQLSYNPAPITTGLTLLVTLYMIRQERLFGILPIARARVLEHIDQGMLVLDKTNRIVDVNSAAERLLGKPAETLLKKPADQIFGQWPELMAAFTSEQPVQVQCTHRASVNVATYIEARVIPLAYGQTSVGHVVVLNDVTQHKALTAALQEALHTEKSARTYAETLKDITLLLTETTSTREVLQQILRQVERFVAYDSANISLFEEDVLRIAEWRGYEKFGPVDFLDTLEQKLADFPIERRAVASGEAAIITDAHADPEWVVVPATAWIRSHLTIPIRHQERILGLLRLDAAQPHAFSQEDVERLTPLTNVAAIALLNARLHEQARAELTQRRQAEQALQKRLTQLEALFRFTEELSPLLDVQEVCEAMVRGVHTYLGFQYVGVFLLDEETDELVLRANLGWNAPPHITKIAPDQGLSRRAIEERQTRYTPDVSKEPDYVSVTPELQPGSEVDVPILVNGRSAGVLIVERSQTGAFSKEDIDILTAIGNEAGIALSRAFTHSQLEQAESKYRQLLDNIPLGLYRTTPDGRFLAANRALAQILHYPNVTTLLETQVINLYVNPSEREKWRRVVESQKDTSVFEVQTRCYDGEIIWIRNRGKAVRDETGQVLYYDGFIEDITAEVQGRSERLRHLQRIEQQTQQMAALNEIFLEMSQELDVQPLLHSITVRAVSLLRGTGGGIYLAEPTARRAVCVVSYNTPHDYTGTSLSYGEGAAGLVIATGRPQIIPDYRIWPNRALTYEEEQPFISVISVPMVWRDQVLGTIEVLHDRPGYFTQEHLDLLTLFARQAAVALRNAQLLEKERKRQAQLEVLRRASLKVTSTLDLQGVLKAILESVFELLLADDAHIFLYNGQELTFGAAYWEGKMQDRPFAQPRKGGITYTVARTGEAQIIPSIDEHPAYKDWKWGGALASFPLKSHGRIIGVMNVAFARPHEFTEEEVHLLTLFADQAAIAIEHAELFAKREQYTRDLILLQNILQVLNASQYVGDAFSAMTNHLVALTHADRISLTLLDENGEQFILKTLDARTNVLEDGAMLPLHISAASEDILEGRVHITPDLSTEANFPAEQALFAAGYRSRINIPLRVEGQIIGSLNFGWTSPKGLHDEDVPLLQHVADALALAIERDRLMESTRRQAEELSSLYETSLLLGRSLDLPSWLENVHDALDRFLSPDAVGVFLYHAQEDEIEVLSVRERGEHLVILEDMKIPACQAGLTGWIAQHRRPLLIRDLPNELDTLPVPPRHVTEPPLSFVGIPLMLADRVVGVLTVQSFRAGAFSEQHQRFLESLGAQLAIMLENARMYEAERRAREETEHLLEAAQALSATLDLPNVFERILTELQKVVPYDSASVQELRENRLVIIGGRGFANPEEIIGLSFDVSSDRNPNREVVLRREPVILADAPTRYKDFTQEPYVVTPIRSWLGIPMLYGDRVIGLITLDKREPGFYTAGHARVAQAFATQAAIAIENARLYHSVQEQAQRVQRILDTMPDGVYLLDAEKCIISTNPAGTRFLDLLGSRLGAPMTHIGDFPVEELLASPLDGPRQEVEINDPERHIFEVAARPLGDPGAKAGWVLLLRDVTRERQIQIQVEQQERLAAIGQLAAGIAHDFNNILQGIIGFSRLLSKREDLPEDVRRRLRMIGEQGERGARLVHQILDFSRRSTPHRTLVALDDVVREALPWLRSTLPEEISLSVEVEPWDYRVNIDITQMQQVLTNLVLNARDAMPRGGTIILSLRQFTLLPEDTPPVAGMRPGPWVQLAVIDTGVGIPEDILPHIFEPFFTTKDVDKGTGLGLAQVYGIIQQHEGFITVKSEEGRGSTFTIYLPWRASLPLVGVSGSNRSAPESNSEKDTVLIVHPVADRLQRLSHVVTRLGYRAIQVGAVEEALDTLHGLSTPPVAVLSEFLTLPGTLGLPVPRMCEVIKAGHIPLILLGDQNVPKGVKEAGCILISTNIDSDEFINDLRETLKECGRKAALLKGK